MSIRETHISIWGPKEFIDEVEENLHFKGDDTTEQTFLSVVVDEVGWGGRYTMYENRHIYDFWCEMPRVCQEKLRDWVRSVANISNEGVGVDISY